MRKRLLAILLALTMCFSLLPVSVQAEETDGEYPAVTTEGKPENENEVLPLEKDGDKDVEEGEEHGAVLPEEPSKEEEDESAQGGSEGASANDSIALIAEGDGETWDKVEWNEIQNGGTYAITMEVEGKVYLLPNAKTSSNPGVVETALSNEKLMAASSDYGWTFEGNATDGFLVHNVSGKFLAYSGSSTGVRVNDTASKWTYVAAPSETIGPRLQETSSNRYLCVFNNKDWRLYATSNLTAGTMTIWHLSSETEIKPPVETKVKTPTATPAGGSMVSPCDTITLSCITADVIFQTSLDKNTWENLEENTFTIPDDASGSYTIYVKAVKEGLEGSDVLTLKYTIPEPQTPPADGTKLVIYNAKNKVVTGALNNSSKLAGVSATLANGKLTVDGAPTWLTVEAGENGTYAFKTDDGKYLTSTTSNAVTLEDTPNASSWWTLTDAGNGWYIKNAGTTNLTFQYYSGFSTYTGSTGDAYLMELYTEADVTVKLPDPPKETYKPADGDVVAIYYPKDGLVMNANIKGTAASAGGGVLFTDGSQLMLTVSVDENGNYTFTSGEGKVLNTVAEGGNLTLVEADKAVCSAWTLEAEDNGWMIHSTEAAHNGNKNQYIEYHSGQFKVYGYTSGDKEIYTMQFFPAASIKTIDYTVDTEVEQTIAQWGGGSHYEDSALSVQGDLLTVGDMLDSKAVFTAVKKGDPVKPFTTGTSAGTTTVSNWYMGGTSIGATENDYLHFAMSSKGWGGMKLSFRMRATDAAPGSWTLQYSTNGTDFADFTTGSYSASYTSYPQGVATPVTLSGTISDGVAKTSLAAGNYVSFEFDVPVGAEDAENLYIRLVPGSDRADGDSAKKISGTVRIDTVKLTGSPIVSDKVTSYVQVDPDNSDEVGSGTTISLTSESGAAISYGWADNTTGVVTYTAGNSTVVPGTLPATLFVKAQAPGKAESVTRMLTYLPASVASVKMDPNGGGVFTGSGSVSVTLSTATDGATIYYTRSDWAKVKNDKGEDVDKYEVYTPGTTEIVLNKGFGELTVSAYAEKDGFTTSAVSTRTFTERNSQTYNLFFGQMHSHTSYSDGAGTAEQAFSSVKALDHDKWNMDFLSVTDHSNSFDDAGGTKRINDAPTGQEWNEGKALASGVTDSNFVGIFGYEMTWSNGLGHINTFNTTGFQDRTQSNYTTYSTALQNYYAELKTASASISQFNHPGTTFGDFSDFSYFDEEIDQLITLIEVGNGEGAIGSSGYFPSYEYYTRALDKGWHVAPTNNQDNHKGGWGTSNTGRDVVLVDELTEQAIYDAMRNYRVYATEDLNLEIYYTFDGNIMGSILDADSYGKDDKAIISVDLHDKDDTAAAKIQVIVNGGAVAAETTATCNETVTLEVPTIYAYYYIKVTQADGDIAVTAPVWVGKVEAVGISGMSTTKDLTVVGQEQGFTLDLYNNETKNLEISSIVFTDKATGEVLHTAKDVTRVPKMGTASTSFTHTFTTDGSVTVTATVKGTLNDVEKTYTQDIELKVMPKEVVSKIVVDGSHYNDYVTGYYGANMNNMTSIAATLGVDVVIKTDTITAADLEDCQLLVISAPARKAGTANAGDYVASLFEDSFIQTVKAYVAGGGSVAVCGLADYQDKGAENGADGHAAAQLNKLLAEIGSTMRINDDEAYDDDKNGGQAYRLYPEIFNMDSKWCKGIVTYESPNEYGSYQTYSQYSGCTVDPGSGTWLVKGFDTTYSIDSDKDGKGGVEKGNAYFLACEEVGNGNVFAAGGVFLSDFEVKAELDNIFDLPYANRTIFENMLSAVREGVTITPIAETRAAPLNKVFTIEGYVTSGTTNPNTTFFDSIYVQDETGGTDVFPYATEGLAIGTKVRVLGYTDAYQGDRELQVISLEILDAPAKVYEPKELTTEQATDYATYGGQLVSVSGKVSDIVMAGGRVSQFKVTDSSNKAATVFIDGYITNPSGVNNIHTWIKDGQTVTAVGLLYSHPEGDSDVSVPVLRVRNCDEITGSGQNTPAPTPGGTTGSGTGTSLPVSTESGSDNGTVVTETTAVIESKTEGTAASAAVSGTVAQEIVNQAVRNDSDAVVIAPNMGSDVTKADVSIPASTVAEIAEKTDAELRVETPVAGVTIPNEGLSELAEAGGKVTVSAERSGSTVEVAITSNGKQVDKVTGGVMVSIPQANCTPGTVAMLVHEDGTTEVVRQSVASSDGQSVAVPLDGSAKVVIVDNSVSFSDVSASSWAADAVAFASSHELMNGTGIGVFAPNESMTRGMLAMVLHNLDNNPSAVSGTGFADVADAAWYADAVAWAAANGIITGYSDGIFGPNNPVTREQLAVMLYRYAGSPDVNETTLNFVDAGDISGYAETAIAWAVANGILNGKGGGILDPKGAATRAEVAQMMLNFVSSMV